MIIRALLIFFLLTLSACGDENKPFHQTTIDPLGQSSESSDTSPVPDQVTSASKGRCQTFRLDRIENGNRRTAKIRKALWNDMSYASVRFSDGFFVSRVNMRKANRINSGKGNGFVSRLGSSYTGIYVVAPYGRRPSSVQYCPVR